MQHTRHIRSFVLRAGRMTPAQERALTELWPVLRRGIGGRPTGLGDDLRTPRAALPGDRLRGRGSDRDTGGGASRDIDYLGIEVHRPGVGRLLLRAAQAALSNLRVICHDAVEVLTGAIRDRVLRRDPGVLPGSLAQEAPPQAPLDRRRVRRGRWRPSCGPAACCGSPRTGRSMPNRCWRCAMPNRSWSR